MVDMLLFYSWQSKPGRVVVVILLLVFFKLYQEKLIIRLEGQKDTVFVMITHFGFS